MGHATAPEGCKTRLTGFAARGRAAFRSRITAHPLLALRLAKLGLGLAELQLVLGILLLIFRGSFLHPRLVGLDRRGPVVVSARRLHHVKLPVSRILLLGADISTTIDNNQGRPLPGRSGPGGWQQPDTQGRGAGTTVERVAGRAYTHSVDVREQNSPAFGRRRCQQWRARSRRGSVESSFSISPVLGPRPKAGFL